MVPIRFHKFFDMLLVAGLIAVKASSDTVIFMDDFDGENTGNVKIWYRNYRSFANWDVTSDAMGLLSYKDHDRVPGKRSLHGDAKYCQSW